MIATIAQTMTTQTRNCSSQPSEKHMATLLFLLGDRRARLAYPPTTRMYAVQTMIASTKSAP